MQTANQQRAKQNATFGCLGAIVLLFLIAWVWGKASPKPAEPAPVGSRGTLSVASDPTVLLAVDNVAFDELAKSLIAKDWVGVASLID
ncbi:MAG: hypothetical protein ABSD48_13045, partial [Armatimonadota bacterium]